MSESESSDDTILFSNENNTILDNNTNITLDNDYMLSLKLYFEQEDEENHQDNIHGIGLSCENIRIIKKIYNFLKNINKTNEEIINAICLLYPNNDDVKYLIERLANPVISFTRSLMDIFSNIESQHIDSYSGDIINPSLLLNSFNQNINIFTYPNNYQTIISLETHDINIPSFFSNFINTNNITHNITQNNDIKNVATDTILNQNTKILFYSELDDISKTNYKTCSICIDDYDDKSEIRQLKCTHIFHIKCIDPWLLKESYKCPLCRDDTLPHEHK
jgi:hypothetical protein